MTDVSHAIQPKSDQLNAEDFIASPITAQIERVDVRQTTEQPVSVFLAGHQRPWKPCKSMLKVMAGIWGTNSQAWIGHAVTLFNDTSVKWAGTEVGGIRISHMTGIDKERQFNLSVSRGKRKIHKINPLSGGVSQPQPENVQQGHAQPVVQKQPTQEELEHFATAIGLAADMQQLAAVWGRIPPHVKASLSSYKDARKLEIESMQLEPQQEQKPQDISSF